MNLGMNCLLSIVICLLSVTGSESGSNSNSNSNSIRKNGIRQNSIRQRHTNERREPRDDFRLPIIDGQETVPFSKPYMAGLVRFGTDYLSLFCGGTLITPDVVLTAAHCVDSIPGPVTVALGRHNLESNTEDSSVIVVNTRIVYSSRFGRFGTQFNFDDDYGLVLFDEPVNMSGLALGRLNRDSSKPVNDDTLRAIGWGLTETGDLSPVLKEANVTYLDDDTCANINPEFPLNERTVMCAAYDTGTICQGDSGSPLFVANDPGDHRDDLIVGLVSFTATWLCLPGHVAGYARISERIHWIDSHVCTHTSHAPEDFPCDDLPSLTVVLRGTGTASLSLSVAEDDGGMINLPSFGRIDLDEDSILKKVYLYPVSGGTWRYEARLDVSGFVELYQLWLGDAADAAMDGGILLKERAGSANISDDFAFLLDEEGDPILASFAPSSSPAPSSPPSPSSQFDDKPENGPYLVMTVELDIFPEEFGWVLTGDEEILYEQPFNSSSVPDEEIVLYLGLTLDPPNGTEYVFTVFDSFGDGNGLITLTYVDADNVEYLVGLIEDFQFSASIFFFVDGNGAIEVSTLAPSAMPSFAPSFFAPSFAPSSIVPQNMMEIPSDAPSMGPSFFLEVLPEQPSGPYLHITVTFDLFPEEFSWGLFEVLNGTSILLYNQSNFNYLVPFETVELYIPLDVNPVDGSTFIFVVLDDFGDGLDPPGGLSLVYVDPIRDMESTLYEFGRRYFVKLQTQFTVDGNGILETLSPTMAPTMGPTTALEIAPEDGGGPLLVVVIKLDVFPEEFGWVLSVEELVDGQLSSPPVILYEQPIGTYTELFKEVKLYLPLKDGGDRGGTGGGGGSLYNFTALDSGGNGICCEYGQGFYILLYVNENSNNEEESVIGGGGRFLSSSESISFFVNSDGQYVDPRLSEVPSTMPSEFPSLPPHASKGKKGKKKKDGKKRKGKDGHGGKKG